MTIKDIFDIIFCSIFLLYIIFNIINAYCYYAFYSKYNEVLKKYDYIVGYMDGQDIILNRHLDGDVYINIDPDKDLKYLSKCYIMNSVHDFRRLSKDNMCLMNETAYGLHFSKYDDDDNAKEHIVYMISNVYYTPEDIEKITKSFKEM